MLNKQEFMNSLNNALWDFFPGERNEIMYDYEEHFSIGLAGGKTEEEICRELGNPENIAEQYRSTASREEAPPPPASAPTSAPSINIFRIIFVIIGLFFANLFVLPIFLGVWATLLGLFIASIAITFSGVLCVFGIIIKQIFPSIISYLDFASWISVTLYGVGLVSLGLLFYLGVSSLAKVSLNATTKYLKMNLNVILGRR